MTSIEIIRGDTSISPGSTDEQRVIAIVTGANGGVGQGLCERLLEIYSLPAGHVIREALPQRSALLPTTPDASTRETVLTGPALTLILAVRNQASGEETKRQLLKRLREVLVYRSRHEGLGSNQSARWLDELRIEVERVDFETPYGPHGILAFTRRMRERFPYITSIYANAGYMACQYISWPKVFVEICRVGLFRTFAFPDKYQVEKKGVMTRDGERGAVWSINTLAPYMLIKELASLLDASPTSLGIPPRFVYTSSSTAELERFDGVDTSDAQMIGYAKTYSTTKYAANEVIGELDMRMADVTLRDEQSDLDAHENGKQIRRTRCLVAEPAIVQTSVGSANFAGYWILANIIEAFQWLTFYLCRLCGSPYHVRDGRDAATALIYASLVPDRYLPSPSAQFSASTSNAGSETSQSGIKWRFGLRAHPFSDATVEIKEHDRWSDPKAQEIGRIQMKACEDEWRVARHREGMDVSAP